MTNIVEIHDDVDRKLPQYLAYIAISQAVNSKRYSIRTKHLESIKEALAEYLNNRISK